MPTNKSLERGIVISNERFSCDYLEDDSPFKSTKDGRGLKRAAVAATAKPWWREAGSKGNETGKPEDHGDGINGNDGVEVCSDWEEHGRENHIGYHDEGGPDAAKQKEV